MVSRRGATIKRGRRSDERDVRPERDGELPLAFVEIAVDGVGHARRPGDDLERGGDGAEGALGSDAAAGMDRQEVRDQSDRAAVNGEHAEALDVIVGAVVELEAEAHLADGRRAHPDEDRPFERLTVDLHGPLEALEQLVDERSIDQRGAEAPQQEPGGARWAIAARSVVLAQKVSHQAVSEDEPQGVADPEAAAPHRRQRPIVGDGVDDGAARKVVARSRMPERGPDHVHRATAEEGERGIGASPKARPSAATARCNVPSPPCTAMIAGGAWRSPAAASSSSSSVCRGVDAPTIAEQRLELRRRPRVAPIRPRARVDEESDGGVSRPRPGRRRCHGRCRRRTPLRPRPQSPPSWDTTARTPRRSGAPASRSRC